MRNCLAALLVLLVFDLLAFSQTADELVNKYIEARGGMDKIKAIQTLRITAKQVSPGGFTLSIVEENKRPNLVRSAFSLQGMTGVQAYDGTTGWQIRPFGGKKDPQLMGEDDMRDLLIDSDFDGPLVDYKAKGNAVEYMGHDSVDGDDALRLKVTLKDGDIIYYYLDPDAYLEIREERQEFIRGSVREHASEMGSYKPIHGVMYPFSITAGPKDDPTSWSTITVNKVEVNIPLADSDFALPASLKKEAPHQVNSRPSLAQTNSSEDSQNMNTRRCSSVLMQSSMCLLGVIVLLLGFASAQEAVKFDAATISGLPARNIGSATMSGRIAAVDAIDENGRITIFVGSASGGVWKSINGGTTFKPVFDREPVQSIGAVAIDHSSPKNVWVGTGEPWTRNSVSVGDGIYKSTDGGENWTNMGLKDSEHIAKILVNPKDSNDVVACATGHLWNDNEERGVYKTNDGGKTWNKVLAGSNGSTGCAMLAMSAQDPRTVFAAMWDFRRQGWTFRSGGPGSGLYKSTDGGEHWTELTNSNSKGLPEKPYGRIALAVAPSKPQVVYAMIESKQSAMFRSDDGGSTWNRLDDSQFVVWRPFYFANLIVDPKNENKIFKPDGPLMLSVNGGRSFSSVANTHGDNHDLWIDPADTNVIYVGDDGGFWRSDDGGTRWRHLMNLPVSQFYHVSLDNDNPYHVYGGLQDNSSWVGDSSYPGGVTNSRWENMYGGDGFWMFEDPSDPNYIYAESQGGEIGRVNRHTLETRSIKPFPNYNEKKLRFNWNAPIALSPNEKGTIYLGAQFLFRSRDHGQSWERISPDLTTNDPEKQKQEESGGVTVDNSSAEMNTTIYSISESPKNGQIIWVGTDDGNVQITRDGAKSWTNVVGNVPGQEKNSWVSWVEASRFDESTAYATFDRHTFGDMTPYAFKTTDYGKTWTSLHLQENGVQGYAHVIKEDTVDPNLLFVGTEFGLWISCDGGQRWAQYKGSNFPAVAVRDLAIQPRDSALVLATHGRGIWIIDDITPLRALTPDLMAKDATLIQGPPDIQYLDTNGGWAEGDATFIGPSRSSGAFITYYQRRRHIFGDLKLEIFDQNGKLVDTLSGSTHRGLNRTTWSMRMKPPIVTPAATALFEAAQGPRVLPGTYTVKLTKGDQVYTEPLKIVIDPRAKYNVEDRQAHFDLMMKIYGTLEHMSYGASAIADVRDSANARASKLPEKDALRGRLQHLAQESDNLRSKIVATKEGGAITGEQRIREYLGELYADVDSYEGRPTDYQATREDALSRELEDVINDFKKLTDTELPAINKELRRKKMEAISVLTEPDWHKQHEAGGSSEKSAMSAHADVN